jgi:ribosome maturation factor RimP
MEEQDYSLKWLSRGFFTIKEDQTIQENIGRTLIVKTNTENIEAELVKLMMIL